MAVASPKARSTEKKAVGGVHETGRIPFFLFRVTFAGTVAGLARRAVGYIYIYIYIHKQKNNTRTTNKTRTNENKKITNANT